jgi:hypothetical protein
MSLSGSRCRVSARGRCGPKVACQNCHNCQNLSVVGVVAVVAVLAEGFMRPGAR